MEGASSEAKIPPGLSTGRSTIEEKLSMTSPNNSRNMIESPTLVSPRPRRAKPGKSRRRSFESIDLSCLLPQGSGSEHNINNEGSKIGEKLNMMSPNNSNHSLSKMDAQKVLVSPQARSRSGRPRNYSRRKSFDSIDLPSLLPQGSNSDDNLQKDGRSIEDKLPMASPNNSNHSLKSPRPRGPTTKFSRRRSLNSSFFVPPLSVQAVCGDENLTNDRSAMEEKLNMTSPNNNLDAIDTIPKTTTSRSRSRSGHRRRRRRRSLAGLLTSSEHEDDAKANGDAKTDGADAPFTKTSGHSCSERRHGGAQSLPSHSGHSKHSIWTEMTIHTDTHLLSNHEEICDSSASSESCYYSDGDIPYEPNMSYTMQITGEDVDDDIDDDDDSSNPNFNYLARDNGSLQTLDSVFSLNELGSIGTISSLSVDVVEGSESNDSFTRDGSDKRIQFVFTSTPTPTSRQHQRQQRRSSNRSFGRRRRRRYSNDSMTRSGDEFTSDDDIHTLDDSIPSIPDLPQRVSANGQRNRSTCNGSGDELIDNADDIEGVEVSEDEEYFEELVNEHSNSSYQDDSTKRYEIVISDESFEEEIVVEVEEEEITLEDDEDSDSADLEERTESSEEYHIDDEKKFPNFDNIAEFYAACNNHYEDEDDTLNDDLETEFIVDRHNGSPNTYEKPEVSSSGHREDNCQSNDERTDPLSVDGTLEYTVDCQSDDKNEDAPSDDEKKLECVADSQNGEGKKGSPPTIDKKSECGMDGERVDGNKEAPPKTDNANVYCSPARSYRDVLIVANSQNGKDKIGAAPLNGEEKLEFSVKSRNDDHRINSPPTIDKKSECIVDIQNQDKKIEVPSKIEDDGVHCTTPPRREVDCQSQDNNKEAPPKIEDDVIHCTTPPRREVDCQSQDNSKDASAESEDDDDDIYCTPPRSYRDVLLGT